MLITKEQAKEIINKIIDAYYNFIEAGEEAKELYYEDHGEAYVKVSIDDRYVLSGIYRNATSMDIGLFDSLTEKNYCVASNFISGEGLSYLIRAYLNIILNIQKRD